MFFCFYLIYIWNGCDRTFVVMCVGSNVIATTENGFALNHTKAKQWPISNNNGWQWWEHLIFYFFLFFVFIWNWKRNEVVGYVVVTCKFRRLLSFFSKPPNVFPYHHIFSVYSVVLLFSSLIYYYYYFSWLLIIIRIFFRFAQFCCFQFNIEWYCTVRLLGISIALRHISQRHREEVGRNKT